MIWIHVAFATGLSRPPVVQWVDAGCTPLSADAHPPGELRLVWSQTHSTSPPGGPVHTWTDSLQPADLRLREDGCGVEAGRWEALDQQCSGVPVLRWTGTVRAGEDYLVQSTGRTVARVHTAGTASPTCEVPERPVTGGSLEREVQHTVRVPASVVQISDDRTWLERSVQEQLVGTARHMQASFFRAVTSRPGAATVGPDGTIAVTWQGVRRVIVTSGPDEHGDPTCTISTWVDGVLTIDGVEGGFPQQGPTGGTVTPGRCKPGAGTELATERAAVGEIEARASAVRPLVRPETPAVPLAQEKELAAVLSSPAYAADPLAAVEGLVRRSGWMAPQGWAVYAADLHAAGRYLEAAHVGTRALYAMPPEPSAPRASVLHGIAESAAAGSASCEPARCPELLKLGFDALRELQTVQPGDARAAEIDALLRAAASAR